MAKDKERRGFLLIKKTYKVKCQYCGWKGTANLGKTPIATGEHDGLDWCPVCGALALGADNDKETT